MHLLLLSDEYILTNESNEYFCAIKKDFIDNSDIILYLHIILLQLSKIVFQNRAYY